MKLIEQIQNYVPKDKQESADKKQFLDFINKFDDVLTRENSFGHFSASAFVINKKRNKMLVVFHNIYGGWIYPGGHADGENDLLAVAVREVEEETGLKANVLDNSIFSIQILPTTGHNKRDKYIPAHVHYDVVYLLEADDEQELSFNQDESRGAKWISFDEAIGEEMVDFIRPIHQKLIENLNKT